MVDVFISAVFILSLLLVESLAAVLIVTDIVVKMFKTEVVLEFTVELTTGSILEESVNSYKSTSSVDNDSGSCPAFISR
jgi:hypothetical protein